MEQFRTSFRSVTDRPAATLLIFPFQLSKLRILLFLRYSEVEGLVPSTSCSHHSLILVIQCLITQLLLAYNCLFPHWVVVARPIVIDDVVRRSRL